MAHHYRDSSPVFDSHYVNNVVAHNCFNQLEQPVILTSGMALTPFFLNGENAIGDNAKDYKNHEMNPVKMRTWAVEQARSGTFRGVIDYASNVIDLSGVDILSGGRTRDWPFAAALAHKTGRDFLALFKPEDGSNAVLMTADGEVYSPHSLNGKKVHHVVDLVTEASSATGKGGWIDQIRGLDGDISQLTAFIDRNQGGAKALDELGVKLNSLVTINERFLDVYTHADPVSTMNYLANPAEWSVHFLSTQGLDCLEPYFDPLTEKSRKDNRLLKFVARNHAELDSVGVLGAIEAKAAAFRANADAERGVEAGEDFASALAKYR